MKTKITNFPNHFYYWKSKSCKSTIIKGISKTIIEKFGSEALILLAPISTAVVNVIGKALNSCHFALKETTCFKFTVLKCQIARNLQLSMDPVLFLIIVEFSVIGYRLMADIEQRCLEDKEDILNLLRDLFV